MKTKQKDYYAILGISSGAAIADIKRAYRKLAKQYHPDVNHDPDAAERFRELTEAYDTLTDPDRRSRYDRLYGTHTGRTNTGTGGAWARNTSSGNGAKAGNGPNDIGSQASRILRVLEDTWMEIRCRHPEIPAVVIIIASGTDGKQTRFGHHAPGRWNVAGENRAEIMISGEGLRRPAREVLGTLLHEAAHGPARRHDPLAPKRNPSGPTQRRSNSNLIAAICPCGRSIRVAASTLAAAPITCDACGGSFEPKAS
ncbi:MAG: DnaJ domain-containing protein [Streptosporangiaceae bacterium]